MSWCPPVDSWMRSHNAARWVVLLLFVAHGPSAWGGGFTMTSFGGRRMGMMANLAAPDEVTALAHNPAGLADQPGSQVYIFMAPTFMNLSIEMKAHDPARFPEINPAGCGTAGNRPCPWPVGDDGYYTRAIEPERYFGIIPYLGAATDLGFLGLPKVVVSAAIYAPNFYGAYFSDQSPSAYNFVGGLFLVTAATFGGGVRLTERVSLGGYLSYHYMRLSMSQLLSVTDLLTPKGQIPDAMARVAQGALGDIDLDFSGVDHGVGWGLGALITPVPGLNIGLAYSGGSPARFEGDVTFSARGEMIADQEQFRQVVSGLNYKLPSRLTIEMPIPHALSFGVNVAFGRRFEIGIDYRVWLYNLYKKQKITPYYNPGDKGTAPISEASLSRDKSYSPSWQVAGGFLVRPFSRLLGLELMAGVGYDASPIPDETLTLDNPSLDHVKVTAGVRWAINRTWRLSAGYHAAIFLRTDITTSRTNPPTNVRGGGVSHSPAFSVNYTF